MSHKTFCDACGKNAGYAIRGRGASVRPFKKLGQIEAWATFQRQVLYPGSNTELDLCDECVDKAMDALCAAWEARKRERQRAKK